MKQVNKRLLHEDWQVGYLPVPLLAEMGCEPAVVAPTKETATTTEKEHPAGDRESHYLEKKSEKSSNNEDR